MLNDPIVKFDLGDLVENHNDIDFLIENLKDLTFVLEKVKTYDHHLNPEVYLDYTTLSVYTYREETDKEYLKRIKIDATNKARKKEEIFKKEEAEKRELSRLSKKYPNYNLS